MVLTAGTLPVSSVAPWWKGGSCAFVEYFQSVQKHINPTSEGKLGIADVLEGNEQDLCDLSIFRGGWEHSSKHSLYIYDALKVIQKVFLKGKKTFPLQVNGLFPCISITVNVTWKTACNCRESGTEQKPTLYLLSFWFSSSIRSWYFAISDWMELRNVLLWSVSIGSSWEQKRKATYINSYIH